MNPETANWLAGVEYDLETARSLLRSERYLHMVFACHLAVERTLKALVCEQTNAAPPRTHDLNRLAVLGKVQFGPEYTDFVNDLTDANVATRYYGDLAQMMARYPREVAEDYLHRTEELIAWPRADPRLQR